MILKIHEGSNKALKEFKNYKTSKSLNWYRIRVKNKI